MKQPDFDSLRKGAWIAGAILVTAAVSGYFMGLQQTTSTISATRPTEITRPDAGERRAILSTQDVPVAVSYAKQDWLRDGANAGWINDLTRLAQPDHPAPVPTNVSAADRRLVLQQRAERRAYDGAPPVVPHPIAQDSSAACLACHQGGLLVRDRIAPKMSHALFTGCTQCHVPAGGSSAPTAEFALLDPIAENTFAAAPAPAKGNRAWPEAPPTVPHSTHMRSDCMSCHGPTGLFALRTPHPERQACTQCHAPNAELDQHRFLSDAAPRFSPQAHLTSTPEK